MDLRIDTYEQPAHELKDAILDHLLRFNAAVVGSTALEPLALVLRLPGSDAVAGGLWAESAYRWMFIHLLIVPESFRGRGIGRTLIGRAEEIARKRGCIGVRLDTYSFQAPGFYARLGYEVLGRLSNYPPGHDDFICFKYLAQEQM